MKVYARISFLCIISCPLSLLSVVKMIVSLLRNGAVLAAHSGFNFWGQPS